jgi:phosphotransferase system  glucose/maltose/N-acetylglucosamine-specific IIC component
MKVLKAICVILSSIFFMALCITPLLYGDIIKDLRFGFFLVILFFLLAAIFYIAFRILKDHEENAHGRQTNERKEK